MGSLLVTTWRAFRRQDGRLLSGAVAFYVILALAPLGVIALAIAGTLFGREAARNELVARIETFLGAELAEFTTGMIRRTAELGTSWVATAISVGVMLYVTTYLFEMVRRSLNHLWGIRSQGIQQASVRWKFVARRLFAFLMVFISGASLIAFVIIRSLVQLASQYMGELPVMQPVIEFATAFVVLSPLVAIVFRWLPDAEVDRRDAWVGAAATAFFLTAGSFVIGLYFATYGVASAYGTAGSFVALLLWIYYNTQIFFLGAEFTRTWAEAHGRSVEPLPHASRVVTEPVIEEDSFGEELSE